MGLHVETEVVAQVDHFTIVQELSNRAYILTKVITDTILQKNHTYPNNQLSKHTVGR